MWIRHKTILENDLAYSQIGVAVVETINSP